MSGRGEGHPRKADQDEKSPPPKVPVIPSSSSSLLSEEDYDDDVSRSRSNVRTDSEDSLGKQKSSLKSRQVKRSLNLRPSRRQEGTDEEEESETTKPLHPPGTLTSSIVQLRNSQRQLLSAPTLQEPDALAAGDSSSSLGKSKGSLQLSDRGGAPGGDSEGDLLSEKQAMGKRRPKQNVKSTALYPTSAPAPLATPVEGATTVTPDLERQTTPASDQSTSLLGHPQSPMVVEKSLLAQRRKRGESATSSQTRSVNLYPLQGNEPNRGDADPSQEVTHTADTGIELHPSQEKKREKVSQVGVELHSSPKKKQENLQVGIALHPSQEKKEQPTAQEGVEMKPEVKEIEEPPTVSSVSMHPAAAGEKRTGNRPENANFPGGTMTSVVRAQATRAPTVSKSSEMAQTSGFMSPAVTEVISTDVDDDEVASAKTCKKAGGKPKPTQLEFDPSTWSEQTPYGTESTADADRLMKQTRTRRTAELLAPTEPDPLQPTEAGEKQEEELRGKSSRTGGTDGPAHSTKDDKDEGATTERQGFSRRTRRQGRRQEQSVGSVASSLSDWVADVLNSTTTAVSRTGEASLMDEEEGVAGPIIEGATTRAEESSPTKEEQDVVVVEPQKIAVLDQKPKQQRPVIDPGKEKTLLTQSQRDFLADEGFVVKDREIVADEELQAKLRKRKRCIAVLIAVGFGLLGIIGGVLGYVFAQSTSESTPSSDTFLVVNNETAIDNSTEVPSIAPSQVPSLAPTTTREECIISTFEQNQASGVTDDMLERMKNSSTPQNRAVKWLAMEDVTVDCTNFTALRERYAFATFYYSTDGPNWKNQTDWMVPGWELCWWYLQEQDENNEWITRGIDCQDADFVALRLEDNNLVGTIPPELALVRRNFRAIYLPDNSLSGTLPAVASNWMRMTTLALNSNSFHGTIPASYGNVPSLESVNFTHNVLSGSLPPSLGDIASLRFFGAAYNMLTGSIPTTLRNLVNLTALLLNRNLLTGNFAEDVVDKALPRRRRMKYLWLSNNALTGTILPDVLGDPVEFPKFSSLDIRDNPDLSGTIPLSWQGMSSLFELSLGGCDFYGTLSDFFSERAAFPHLLALRLNENKFEGNIPSTLFTMYPDLRVLEIAKNNMNGTIPPEIGNARNLKELSFSSNDLHGTIPTTVGNMVNMRFISLSANSKISGNIPSEMGQMSSLEWIDLREDSLTGSLPPELGNLRNLAKLLVDHNDLTGTVPSSYSKLERLDQVDFSGNRLSGDLNFLCPVNLMLADCDDTSGEPEIECGCCALCCNDEGICFEQR